MRRRQLPNQRCHANKILAEHSGGTKAVTIATPLISNRRKRWLATAWPLKLMQFCIIRFTILRKRLFRSKISICNLPGRLNNFAECDRSAYSWRGATKKRQNKSCGPRDRRSSYGLLGIKSRISWTKDVEIPQTKQRAMDKETEAAREMPSWIIKVEAEQEASQKRSDAAKNHFRESFGFGTAPNINDYWSRWGK